jgi:hypothetical protein
VSPSLDYLRKIRETHLTERELASAKRTLAEGPAESNTFVNRYGDAPRPLGTGTGIQFVVEGYSDGAPRVYFEAKLDSDRNVLTIYGSDSLAVFPQSSNVVNVKLQRHR